jgi:hypothetical protein
MLETNTQEIHVGSRKVALVRMYDKVLQDQETVKP